MTPETNTAVPEAVKAVQALTEDFKGLTSELKSRMDEADAERKTLGASTDETKAAIATLTSHYEDLQKELAEKSTELRDLQMDMARRGTYDGDAGETAKSVGQQFLESSEFKTMVERKERSSAPMRVGSFHTKGNLTSGAADRLAVPQRVDMVGPAERVLTIRDLIPTIPTAAGAIEFVRETGFFGDGDPSAVTSITQTGGVATVTTTAPHGLYIGAWVLIAAADQEAYNGLHRVRSITGASTFTITVPTGTASPGTGTITFCNAQAHGGAAPVAEGSPKPQATLTFELVTRPVSTIAHWIPASRQILDDAPQLAGYIDQRLVYGLRYAEEQRQLLYGDGNSPNLPGLMNEPNVLTYQWSAGEVGDQKGEAIRRAMTLVALAEYSASGIVVNPLDWEDVELSKSNDGQYLYMQGFNATGMPSIWRVPVVSTSAIAAGEALVGAFAQAAAIYDREQANIRIAEQHAEQFTSNMVTILAEERLALATYRPEAFVRVSFDEAPAT